MFLSHASHCYAVGYIQYKKLPNYRLHLEPPETTSVVNCHFVHESECLTTYSYQIAYAAHLSDKMIQDHFSIDS
uniref:Uncharacterized protein n=1 Tax=Manihot esculenta TaxID=3983 RepID=A0A2C9VYC2_MANES